MCESSCTALYQSGIAIKAFKYVKHVMFYLWKEKRRISIAYKESKCTSNIPGTVMAGTQKVVIYTLHFVINAVREHNGGGITCVYGIHLFIWGFYVPFNTVQVIITMGSFVCGGNKYIQLVKVLNCKLPSISKQLPTFPHKVRALNPRPQRWEGSVLPLCHHGPLHVCCRLLQISGALKEKL